MLSNIDVAQLQNQSHQEGLIHEPSWLDTYPPTSSRGHMHSSLMIHGGRRYGR